MSNRYPVSVIIPTYNRAQLLNYTLRSLEQQTLPANKFEVIVADDGSGDNTREIVERFKGRMNIKYVFQEDEGYRPASARNMGIMASEANICLFLDSGVMADEHCLKAHMDLHKDTDSPVAIIGYVYGFDQEGADSDTLEALINVESAAQTIRQFKQGDLITDVRDPFYRKYNDRIEDMPAPWVYFWTCNVSARRQDLIEIGMFDENYNGNWGCEDNDLAIRLQQRGIKIVLNRKAASIHYPHDKDMSVKAAQGYINCQYMHRKFNTLETALFLENYIQNVTNESVDINELILSAVLAK
jgi:glycosyltransferase involved in cell wall biosynthesis